MISAFNIPSYSAFLYQNIQSEDMYSFLDDLAASDDLLGYPNFELDQCTSLGGQNSINVSDNNTHVTEVEPEIVVCLTPPHNTHTSDFDVESLSTATSTSCPLYPFNLYPYVQETSDIVPMNPETAVSTTITPDSSQSSTSRKRNHETMSNQSFPSSQAEVDLALIEANKKRKISKEPNSLNYLAKLSSSEVEKNGWFLEECKKINPNFIQENQSYINWCIKFQNFTKEIVEDFKANPEKLDLDNTLAKSCWDFLSEKFIIPNVIKIFLLYYQNFQVKINQYRNILKDQNDIIILNRCETKVNQINGILSQIQKEYDLYKNNNIKMDFIKNITPYVKKLSRAENSFCLLQSKLSNNDKDLSNDKNRTEIRIRNSNAESPTYRLVWSDEHKKAFYGKVSECGVKEGELITQLQAKQIAAEMTEQFKIPFSPSMCYGRLYSDYMKSLERTSVPIDETTSSATGQAELPKIKLMWTDEYTKTFYEIANSLYGIKEGELINYLQAEQIAAEMTKQFKLPFSKMTCYNKAHRDHRRSLNSPSVPIDETTSSATGQAELPKFKLMWTDVYTKAFYEKVSGCGVKEGELITQLQAKQIAAEMTKQFKLPFTQSMCYSKVYRDRNKSLKSPSVQIDETNSSETVQTESILKQQRGWTDEQVEAFYKIGFEFKVIKGEKSISNAAARRIAKKMTKMFRILFTPKKCKSKVYNDYTAQKDKTNLSQTDKTSTSDPKTPS